MATFRPVEASRPEQKRSEPQNIWATEFTSIYDGISALADFLILCPVKVLDYKKIKKTPQGGRGFTNHFFCLSEFAFSTASIYDQQLDGCFSQYIRIRMKGKMSHFCWCGSVKIS
jgi:hypothetical protein